MPRLLESALMVLVSAGLAIGAVFLLVEGLRELLGTIVVNLAAA